MEIVRIHRFIPGLMSCLLILSITLSPSEVVQAQESPPTCAPTDKECIVQTPPIEPDTEPAAFEPAQMHVGSAPPPIRPFVSSTSSQ